MLQMRFVLCLLLVVVVAVSAITVKPLKEQQVQQSLFDVDDLGHGHENTGDRLARQFGRGRGYGGYGGYGRRGGGYRGRGGYYG